MQSRMRFGLSLRVAVALALGLLGALLASWQVAAQEVNLSRITVAGGEDGTATLEALDIGRPGLGAWQIDIKYNPDVVTPLRCEAGDGGVCNANFEPGRVRVIGAAHPGLIGDTMLAEITFRCESNGTTALSLDVQELFDATLARPRAIDAEIRDGAVSCLPPEPPSEERGDVNCDGRVNSVDAALVLQFVAGLRRSLLCEENADVNGDGRIDARDATLILQIDAGLL